MIILGIETSCDDTGIAIVEVAPTKVGVVFDILSNTISSQIKVHQKYGGIVPNLAAREHLRNIEPCLKQAFKQAKVKPEQIDLIAATIGPGLIPSLLIGVHFAKTLAYKWQKPIVGINHIEAHILAILLKNKKIKFPAIALVVSGGHTQLILMSDIGKYKILGETRDDAAGECFDKVAKLLGLGYPGGPEISKQAEECKKSNIDLPRPMINHKNYDFSFSGLKTAVLYKTKKQKVNIPEMAKETQQAIIDVLISKTIKAAKEYKAKTIILSGGVAANEELRNQLNVKCKLLNVNFLVPTKNLCTDNGTMIAVAGYFNKSTKNVKANANLRIGQ
ncbi:MAG TPA: tRNA (adenosine(37)-N6)-threonylcarbamoyltransferase complex transferase subunit TsaD [bacterium]|nr:tRNA (adenosine(37)-N6)-threonylcarbamoyltransferase complex transferase subunit TsaD [bacterium]